MRLSVRTRTVLLTILCLGLLFGCIVQVRKSALLQARRHEAARYEEMEHEYSQYAQKLTGKMRMLEECEKNGKDCEQLCNEILTLLQYGPYTSGGKDILSLRAVKHSPERTRIITSLASEAAEQAVHDAQEYAGHKRSFQK